jgi:hypothetical protein
MGHVCRSRFEQSAKGQLKLSIREQTGDVQPA